MCAGSRAELDHSALYLELRHHAAFEQIVPFRETGLTRP